MQLYRNQYYNIIITVYHSPGIEETFCEKLVASNFVRIIQYIGRYLQQIYLFLYKQQRKKNGLSDKRTRTKISILIKTSLEVKRQKVKQNI